MFSFCRVLFFALSVSEMVCVAAEPDAELKAALNDIVASYMSIPNAEMFTTVHDISPQKPFVFFHVPKAGGSSLRETIYKAAAKAHLRSFIPCHGHIPCETYHFPKDNPAGGTVGQAANSHGITNVSNIAVYGGHFTAAEITDHSIGTVPIQDYYCMTNFRDPFDRIVSNIYYAAERRGKWKGIKHRQCINEVDPSALKQMLQVSAETTYAFTFLSGLSVPIQRDNIPTSDVIRIFNASMRRLMKCTPVILEEPMSFKILSDRYPQLGKYQGFDKKKTNNVGRAKQTCDNPDLAHARVLEESVQLERMLYNAAKAKIRSRLSEVGL